MATTLVRIQLLSKTSTDFATANPVLLEGEFGIANAGSAIPVLKVGDGVRPWTALPDIVAVGAGANYVAGPVNTLPAGSPAEVIIDNTVNPPTISFGIPEGGQGDEGPAGPPNSLQMGTVTTLPPGQPATASITGTPPNQVLSLSIPQGVPGSVALTDPTGLIGLTAVPGVSLLGTRSDATHALSQAIAPTWTGQHTFTNSGAGANAFSISAVSPGFVLNQTDEIATQKAWRIRSQSVVFLIEAVDDGFSNPVTAISITRGTGVAVSAIAFGNTTNNPSYTFNGSGSVRSNGQIIPNEGTATVNWSGAHTFAAPTTVFQNTNGPTIVLSDLDAAVDEKRWRIRSTSGQFHVFAENDAGTAAGTPAILIDRTGTTVDSITFAGTLITFNGTTVATKAQLGTTGALSSPLLAVVAPPSGNSIEWGHGNVAGYRSTIGHTFTSGHSFIAFHAEHGTNANTYRTRGIAGSVIETNAAGAVTFARVTNVSADNQAPTVDLVWGSTGQWGFATPVNIGTAATASVLSMFGPAGAAKHIYFYSGANSRWIIRSNALAESGSNAGSNFEILGVDDPAAVATVYLTIQRSNGTVTIPGLISAASGVVTPAANLTGTQPIIRFNETGAPVNEKLWDITASGGDLFFRTRSDADLAGVTWMSVTRTGAVVDNVTLTPGVIFTRNSTALNGDGAIAVACVTPAISWRATGQAADARAWVAWVDTLTWNCGTINDANTTAAAWVSIVRAGNTIANINFGNTTNNPPTSFRGTGLVSIGGGLTVTGTITGNSNTQAVGNNTTAIATTAFVQAAVSPAVLPPGMVAQFAMSAPPPGWLKADGTAVSRATYAALFAAIGTLWGVGDGSTTFNLPDARGEFLRGLDDGRGVDTGRVIGTAQADAYREHSHQYSSLTMGIDAGAVPIQAVNNDAYYATQNTTGGSVGAGTETRPRNIAVLVCIKY